MRQTILMLTAILLAGCPPGGPGPTGGGAGGGNLGGFGGSTGGGFATGGGSTAGGSTAGGSTSAGGAGGGMTSGGGTTGGGSTSMDAAFTIASMVFDPKVVAGPDGSFHLTHRTQTPDTIVYGRCTSDCGTPARWTFTTVESNNGFLGDARIAVGADGRVHLVYSASGPTRNIYATCAANCMTAGSWTKTDLPTTTDCDSENHATNLAVDTQGRLTFMSSDSNTEKLCVNTCAGSCTTPTSWQSGVVVNIRVSGRRIEHAFAAHGTTLHLVYNDLAAGLRYASCTSNCTQTASWTISNPLFYHGDTPITLAASATGRLALAFNQGTTDAMAPMDVKQFDGRLLAWECSTGCGDRANWQGVAMGDPDDGKNGMAASSLQSGLIVVATQLTGTKGFGCESNCGQPTSWLSGDLDTTAALTAALPDAYGVLGCTVNGMQVRPALAGWSPENPSLAVSANGVLVHTMTKGLRTCPGVTTPASFPGYGRVIFSPP